MGIKRFIEKCIGKFARVKEKNIKTKEERKLWDKHQCMTRDAFTLKKEDFEEKYKFEDPDILFKLSDIIKARKKKERGK